MARDDTNETMSRSLRPPIDLEQRSAYPRVRDDDEQALGLRQFQETLRRGGLDLLQPFALGDLPAAKADPARFPSYRPTQLGLVVGNTRALWPAFQRHLRGLGVRSARELGPDPLDIYVEELVQGALGDLADSARVRGAAVFAHELLPAPIPIQRIADVAGLARLGPAHLSVHARYGPWLALRAVVALDVPAGAGAVIAADPTLTHPCEGCPAPCRRALSGALLRRDPDAELETSPLPAAPPTLSESQRRWLRVRDVCPFGRAHRYSDPQILYHYDRRADALFAERKPRP